MHLFPIVLWKYKETGGVLGLWHSIVAKNKKKLNPLSLIATSANPFKAGCNIRKPLNYGVFEM